MHLTSYFVVPCCNVICLGSFCYFSGQMLYPAKPSHKCWRRRRPFHHPTEFQSVQIQILGNPMLDCKVCAFLCRITKLFKIPLRISNIDQNTISKPHQVSFQVSSNGQRLQNNRILGSNQEAHSTTIRTQKLNRSSQDQQNP